MFRFVSLPRVARSALCVSYNRSQRPTRVATTPSHASRWRRFEGPLGFETVLDTDYVSCAKATRILKKLDDDVDREDAFTEGKSFRLGQNFRCGVRKFFTESARARCSHG